MATAAIPATEIWTVLVQCDDETKIKNYRLPASTTVADLKAKWAADCGVPADTVVLTAVDGVMVSDGQDLRDVGEVAPGCGIVTLIAEEADGLQTEIFKGSGERRLIPARMSQQLEELHRLIRDAFHLSEERLFRVRTSEAPLKYNLSLEQQGVDAGTVLQVDLAFEIRLEDPWAATAEELLVYSSEDAEQLRSDDATNPQRLMCGAQEVDTYGDIADALMPVDGLNRTQLSLSLHVVKDITILADKAFRERWVWPTDRLSKVIPKSSATGSLHMLEGQLLPRSQLLCDADLADHSLVHQGPVQVCITTSGGKRQLLYVPKLGTVSDIAEVMRRGGNTERFALERGDRVLGQDEPIARAVADGGDDIRIQQQVLTVTVTLSDRSVRWRTQRSAMNFTDVVHVLAEKSGLQYHQLIGRTLCCARCQRRLTKAEEEFQVLPAACCELRSLTLLEPTAPATSDAGTQTLSRSGRAPAAHKSVAAGPETVDRKTQTRAVRHDAAAQASVATRGMGAQTAGQPRSAFAQQHPPLTPRPFLIRVRDGVRWRDIRCDLRLRDPVTVGAVRAAVAREVGREPREVTLHRWCQLRGGAEVVGVCGSDGKYHGYHDPTTSIDLGTEFPTEFGDAAGRICAKGDVQGRQRSALTDDAAAFLIVSGRRNFIFSNF